MNIKSISTIAMAIIIAVALFAWRDTKAQTEPEPGHITVSGDAEVRVVPDEVELTLGVETWDEDLGTAKLQNDRRVKAVLDIARGYGVEPRHLQTDLISVEPRYQDNFEKENLIGYFVRKTIVITLQDIDKFEDLLTSVLETDVNYVHGIQFRTTELRQHRDQARALAITAAQEKAEALAGELGQTIGRPTNIREEHAGWYSWYGSWWGYHRGGGYMAQNVIQEVGSNAPTDSGSFAPGQITVNARVAVTFELE